MKSLISLLALSSVAGIAAASPLPRLELRASQSTSGAPAFTQSGTSNYLVPVSSERRAPTVDLEQTYSWPWGDNSTHGGGTSNLTGIASNVTHWNTRQDMDVSVSTAHDFSATFLNTSQGPIDIELDSSSCGTQGSVDFDLVIGLVTPPASLPDSLDATGIDLVLRLKASGQLANGISQSVNSITIPLHGLHSLYGIADLDLSLVITGNADISAISAEVLAGSIDLAGSATLNDFDPNNNELSELTPTFTFTPIQPSISGQVSVSGDISPGVSLQLDAMVIGKGLAAGIELLAPDFGINLSVAGDTNGRVCDGSADPSANFNVTFGAEVDAIAGLTPADDTTLNGRQTFSTSLRLSTCVPVIGADAPATEMSTTTITSFADNCCSG